MARTRKHPLDPGSLIAGIRNDGDTETKPPVETETVTRLPVKLDTGKQANMEMEGQITLETNLQSDTATEVDVDMATEASSDTAPDNPIDMLSEGESDTATVKQAFYITERQAMKIKLRLALTKDKTERNASVIVRRALDLYFDSITD